jgi:hypothetical protein
VGGAADVAALCTLLSQPVVALTIEIDNEAEQRLEHRTTRHGATGERRSPWLVSLVMWTNGMRYVGDGGITVRELEERARTRTNLDGLRRWGYLTIDPDTVRGSRQPRQDAVLHPTPAGRRAQAIWRSAPVEVEERWRRRFGAGQIDELRAALRSIDDRLDGRLPDGLPILRHGLFGDAPTRGAPPVAPSERTQDLPALLSRVLLALALEVEDGSSVSLAMGANFLRTLGDGAVLLRDLGPRCGAASEVTRNAAGYLARQGLAVGEADPAGGRARVIRLTPRGRAAREAVLARVAAVEQGWRERFGAADVDRLRQALEALVGDPEHPEALLHATEPAAAGWRARVSRPRTLPRFPLVLHRGGYPDGS